MIQKNLLKTFWKLKMALGLMKTLKHIDVERIERLIFVCRGNVCRSPYAEAVAKFHGFSALSCGVEVTLSAPAEEMAIQAAFNRGLDISQHRSRSIFDVSLKSTDCLIAMDPSHLRVTYKVAHLVGSQITLMGLWQHPASPDIPDPYGKPLQSFKNCFDEIDNAFANLVSIIEI